MSKKNAQNNEVPGRNVITDYRRQDQIPVERRQNLINRNVCRICGGYGEFYDKNNELVICNKCSSNE